MEMTSIIPDQPTNGLAEATAQAVAAIHARADGLRSIAAFITGNSDLPGYPILFDHAVLISLASQPDPTAAITAWMTRAIEVGAKVAPFHDGRSAGVNLHFGTAHVQVYANADRVSERVEVKRPEWRLSIEIPAHARREQAEAVNV